MSASGGASHGRFGRIEVSETGDAGTYIKVGGMNDQNEDNNQDEVPCHSKDSEGRREYRQGFTDTSWAFTVRTLLKDEGQRILRSSYRSKTQFFMRFYEVFQPGSGLVFTDASQCFVTSAGKGSPLEDINATDYAVRGTAIDAFQD